MDAKYRVQQPYYRPPWLFATFLETNASQVVSICYERPVEGSWLLTPCANSSSSLPESEASGLFRV